MHLGDTYRKFKHDCEEEINSIQAIMGNGQCSNWDKYQRLVGEIQGLRKALDHAEASYEALQTEDDENDKD